MIRDKKHEKEKLILVGNPVPPDWDFQRGIQDATGSPWRVIQCVTNRYGGFAGVTRYFKYFLLPVKIFFERDRYSDILSRDQFFGLVLAFYCRLFRVKNAPNIHVMTFIYKRKRGWIGAVYERFVRSAVTSAYVRHIFVFSHSEIAYYADVFGLPEGNFVSEVLGIKDSGTRFPLREEGLPEIYYAAAGRSNRDYDFIRGNWPEEGAPIYIVSDREKAADERNIHYKRNCFGDDYLGVLSNARAVIVPLADRNISSGQLVVLHAAMLGKPVIVTENDTIADYVTDGLNGFIIPKTAEDLRAAMSRLDDPETYARISASARALFEESFSLYRLGRRMGVRLVQDGLREGESGV